MNARGGVAPASTPHEPTVFSNTYTPFNNEVVGKLLRSHEIDEEENELPKTGVNSMSVFGQGRSS